MRIYTSYFGRLEKLKEAGVYPIGICCYPPEWFRGYPNFMQLGPTPDILATCKKKPELYRDRYYKEVLANINEKFFDEMKSRFSMFSKGADVAMLCYETPDEFCHRHLLAEYLNDKFDAGIVEFGETKYEYKPLF